MSLEKPHGFEMMKTIFEQNVPYAKHTGIELLAAGESKGHARLPDHPETLNHMGSQHAGALFTLGEAASGMASAAIFADEVSNFKASIDNAAIRYKKTARGTILANGTIRRPAAEILREFIGAGEVAYKVDVTLENEKDDVVAEMEVSWRVKTQS